MAKLTSLWKPPERIKVWEWADDNRTLTSESSAEPGKWHSERTPYMIPVMEAFTDPKVSEIYVKSSAQVGKSEVLNNCFGYVVDIDPGPILWIHPTVETGEDYSKRRVAPIIRDTPSLKRKILPEKARSKGNTILEKFFAGGSLAIVGANAPSGLRSKPIRYIFGDEWDAWPLSAGSEGDPAKLAMRRSATFFNRKTVIVSTPTIKGVSRIHDAYISGTQEEWRVRCPNCEEYHFIEFDNIEFDKRDIKKGRETDYEVLSVKWRCPDCGFAYPENVIKRQPGRMVASNPGALEKGIRSFRLNAWVSPWESWDKIVHEFLVSFKDPLKLQVVYNTLFGEVFEDRGELEDEQSMLQRRENYPAEVPMDAVVLTCGVDTQDNRLEYEVVGHSANGDTWGIEKGVIPGKPSEADTWARLDTVLNRAYRHESGKELAIQLTCIDSGGHYTQEVYEACRARQSRRVFAIKGKGGDGVKYINTPTQVAIRDNKKIKCWLYTLGVDAGKQQIMSALKIAPKQKRYCHFPTDESKGYDLDYFNGLLSEKLVLSRSKTGDRWQWEKLPGHTRNEPLDLRNYAMAALQILKPDMAAHESKLRDAPPPKPVQRVAPAPRKKKTLYNDNDW